MAAAGIWLFAVSAQPVGAQPVGVQPGTSNPAPAPNAFGAPQAGGSQPPPAVSADGQKPAAAPADGHATPPNVSAGTQSAHAIATLEFAPSTARFTGVKPTAAYVAPNVDSPQIYPLAPGLPVQATDQSKDGKWVIAATENGQAAFLPLADLGPFKPDAEAEVSLQDTITGSARVIDTATLSVNGQPVTLFGVVDGEVGAAADNLQGLISSGGSNVTCHLKEETYQCLLPNGIDLARAVLYYGAAKPGPDASPDYKQQAEAARTAGRGIWHD